MALAPPPHPSVRHLPTGVSLAESVRLVAAQLDHAGVASPWADARWLVDAATGRDPHRHGDEVMASGAVARLAAMVERRCRREPLQLVLGIAPFRELEIECRAGVFIPRPETEVVAGAAIEAARARGPHPSVVEPCTGTGAIACAVATEVAGAHVTASDRDPAAVRLAAHNADRTRRGLAGPDGLAEAAQLQVVRADVHTCVAPDRRGRIDVLVANPPYLPATDRSDWEPEVADHDPHGALVGGPDGHELVEVLLSKAVDWLAPGGCVVVEIDERRGQQAVATARRAGLTGVDLVHDLAGAPRAVTGRRPG